MTAIAYKLNLSQKCSQLKKIAAAGNKDTNSQTKSQLT